MRRRTNLLVSIFVPYLLAFSAAATPTLSTTADGRSAKQWLTDAASCAGEIPSSEEVGVVSLMNSIAQCQAAHGDIAGAGRTIDWMEKRVNTENGTFGQDTDVITTLSAEISAGRIAQAQKSINAFSGVNNPTASYKLAMCSTALTRLGHVDAALTAVTNGNPANTNIRSFGQIAWAAYASKHVADGDKVMTMALRAAPAASAIDKGIDAYALARILAAREQWAEAFAIASQIRSPYKSEPYWADLILLASDSGKQKSVKTVAGLVMTQWKKQPPSSVEAGAKIVVALAEAKAIPEAKAALEVLKTSSVNASPRAVQLKQVEAELDVWAGDFSAATALLAEFSKVRAGQWDTWQGNFYWGMTRAYAAVDDDVNARAMAAKAAGVRQFAMLDSIECTARTGHPGDADAAYRQFRGDIAYTAVSRLAAGWAQAKDTKGIKAWLDSLDSPLKKMVAEMGVVEGLLHVHLRDPFDSPTWRSSMI